MVWVRLSPYKIFLGSTRTFDPFLFHLIVHLNTEDIDIVEEAGQDVPADDNEAAEIAGEWNRKARVQKLIEWVLGVISACSIGSFSLQKFFTEYIHFISSGGKAWLGDAGPRLLKIFFRVGMCPKKEFQVSTMTMTPSYVALLICDVVSPNVNNFKYKYFCSTVTLKIANNAGAWDAGGVASSAGSVAQSHTAGSVRACYTAGSNWGRGQARPGPTQRRGQGQGGGHKIVKWKKKE